MVRKREFVYWDACVFLAYLRGTPDRIPHIQAVLDEVSKNGDLTIATSTITQVEVAYWRDLNDRFILDDESEQILDRMWHDENVVLLIEFHSIVAKKARTLMRESRRDHGWGLKPNDAIQLATAQYIDASIFHTYDDELFKYSEYFEFDVVEPSALQPSLL